jgi:F0F1-type ATP synthase epsilon subunit
MANKAAQTTTKTDLFYLKVYSPFKVYYEDNVNSISAINDTGPFDILAHHHNFITLLNSCNLVIRTVGKEDTIIIISRGIMQVKTDRVIVFLDV